MGRESLQSRCVSTAFQNRPYARPAYAVLPALSSGYPPQLDRSSRVTQPSATINLGCPRKIVRLAWVRHAASVRPEPGSNSPQKQKPPEALIQRASPQDLSSSRLARFKLKALKGFPKSRQPPRQSPHDNYQPRSQLPHPHYPIVDCQCAPGARPPQQAALARTRPPRRYPPLSGGNVS
jgi:hypothetical protein